MNLSYLIALLIISPISIACFVSYRNKKKLKSILAQQLEQKTRNNQALTELREAEESLNSFYGPVRHLSEQKRQIGSLEETIQALLKKIALVITEEKFNSYKEENRVLELEIKKAQATEASLMKSTRPILERLAREEAIRVEAERQRRLKKEEEERKARRKREEEEEEERRARRRREAAYSSSSSSSWSSSSSSSDWGGGGGSSSGGGASDSW